MAKVLGLGGIFFKSTDPLKLYEWYARWLGLAVEPQAGAIFQSQNMPKDSYAVWSAFPSSTQYFAPSTKEFMFNLIVDHVNEALQQVQQGGAQTIGAVEENEYGKFGWFVDPDGNKVELWEPHGQG